MGGKTLTGNHPHMGGKTLAGNHPHMGGKTLTGNQPHMGGKTLTGNGVSPFYRWCLHRQIQNTYGIVYGVRQFM